MNQRFVESLFFNNLICDWIVIESEKYASLNGGWLTTRHKTYPTTDIEIENIPTIFSFLFTSVFKEVKQKIETLYSINIAKFNVFDLFIVKYDMNGQTDLGMHKDGADNESNFTFSILLNDDFGGCGLRYEDGGIVNPKKGDMMIHTKNHAHMVESLEKGTRYVLVGFLEISV